MAHVTILGRRMTHAKKEINACMTPKRKRKNACMTQKKNACMAHVTILGRRMTHGSAVFLSCSLFSRCWYIFLQVIALVHRRLAP